MTLKYKKLYPDVKAPFRASNGAAAADLFAYCEDITLMPNERKLVPTGIAIELPSADYVAFIFARSGLAIKKGITLSNAVGVIDSDYRGEISVGLINLSDKNYTIKKGERIAQLAIMPVIIPIMCECDTLSDTDRGMGGFGSTGNK